MHRFTRRVDGKAAAIEGTEAPKVVKPHDVVGMRMSVQDGIDFLNIGPYRLYPEFGAGIHNPATILLFDVN
jgi:hypothetical protein